MTIAGGIMGALFHRERTGETTEVDVSLLGVGLWSMGAALALSLQMHVPWRGMVPGTATGNPLTGNYRTKDGRFVALTCLQMGKYWPEACEVLGVPELATDERFKDHKIIDLDRRLRSTPSPPASRLIHRIEHGLTFLFVDVQPSGISTNSTSPSLIPSSSTRSCRCRRFRPRRRFRRCRRRPPAPSRCRGPRPRAPRGR